MGNRLSKIYTRTGDDGTTGMADGSRISKADLLFEVMGDIDELNSQLGLARSYYQQALVTSSQPISSSKVTPLTDNADSEAANFSAHMAQLNAPNFAHVLAILQHLLFNLGGELAMPDYEGVSSAHTQWLESQIDLMNEHLPPLKDFILPTGSILVSQLHVCRSVCRRGERHAVALNEQDQTAIRPSATRFLNRLSDWLFVAARFCCAPDARQEVLWDAKVLKSLL